MKHEYIEDRQIVDRYLMGRLDLEEVARFEEHYLSCPACVEALKVAEAFQAGLKRAVAQDAATAAVGLQVGFVSWLARVARSPRAGFSAAAVLLLLIPLGLTWRELGRERDRNAQLAEQFSEIFAPQQDTLILSLSPERATPGDDPTVHLRLPAIPRWIVLSLELDQSGFDRYRVTLQSDGSPLWVGENLSLNHLDTLTVSLHSSFLSEGDYDLRVAGLRSGGEPVAVSAFHFRALPTD